MSGSTFVVHVASPIGGGQTEDDYVRPAVDGTLSVLRACRANRVQRCVITSSIAACLRPSEADKPANGVIDERHWSEVRPVSRNTMHMYGKSKILAERAAWEYQASLPEAEKFDIVTILPSFVVGPSLRAIPFSSGGFVRRLLSGEMK